MLRMGENTGALDTALLNITYFYNRDVKEGRGQGLQLLGPILTVVLGGMLGSSSGRCLGPFMIFWASCGSDQRRASSPWPTSSFSPSPPRR